MIRRLPALALALAVVLGAVPSSAEPAPGTVAGLDLSTPERAAASFATAWTEGDYFVTYLALDPELRRRFAVAVNVFDQRRVLGISFQQLPDSYLDRVNARMAESASEAVPFPVDIFAMFEAYIGAAAESGIVPFKLHPSAVLMPATAVPETDDMVVPIAESAGGGGLVLRLSAEGRWRVVGFAGRDTLPSMWLYEAP